MPAPLQSSLSNRILARLWAADFAILAPHLEPLTCALGSVLVEQDAALNHTYFLEYGVASLVPISPDGQSAEGGMVGREGYIIPTQVLGSTKIPFKIEIQMAGAGHRLPCQVILAAADASTTLRSVLLHYGTRETGMAPALSDARKVAATYGITVKSLRLYEAHGLLQPVLVDGVEFYTARDQTRIAIILKGTELGFSLDEIEILVLALLSPSQAGAFAADRRQVSDLDRVVSEIRMLTSKHGDFDSLIDDLTALLSRK